MLAIMKLLHSIMAEAVALGHEQRMKDSVDIQVYVSAATESSRRTSSAMYLLLVASVVIFAAYWNVRPGSWTASRIIMSEDALRWYGWREEARAKLSPDQRAQFDRSRRFAQMFNLTTREALEADIKHHTDRYRQQSVISIPIFNIQVDVSDLGLLGGFTFVNLLILLRLSLGRELANLKFVFAEANRRQQLQTAFHLLSMHQVLAVPPHQGAMIGRFWSKTNRALLVLPLIIQSLVFKNDWQTREYGMALNEANTVAQLGAGVTSLLLITVLTMMCFRIWEAYDREWNLQAEKLKVPDDSEDASL